MGQVNLTDSAEKSLVEKISKAVAEAAQLNVLEVHKQYARAEAELSQARLALTHKDQQISGLEARVAQLSGIITTISQAGSAPAVPFSPYNNNGHAPAGTVYPLPGPATDPFPATFAPVQAG